MATAEAILVPLLAGGPRSEGQRLGIEPVIQVVAVLAATGIVLRGIDRRPWSEVGLARPAAAPRVLVTGLTAGTAAIGATVAVLLALGGMRLAPNGIPGSWAASALRVTLVLLPAALAEELLLRGYLLTAVRDALGERGAVAVTSILFGLVHVANPGATVATVITVMMAGLFLAMVRVTLNSLYAAWMAHFAWNWVMAVPLHARVSGIRFDAPGYEAVPGGPPWLSGGGWGPEGSIVSALALMGGLAYFYARRRREESELDD